ncbi:MAG TPA: hypothetical protein VGP64_12905 [Polyangia bacterium]|jgi:hypothetical protein
MTRLVQVTHSPVAHVRGQRLFDLAQDPKPVQQRQDTDTQKI